MDYLNFATRASSCTERSDQWRAVTQATHAELGDDREAGIRGCDLGPVRLCDVVLGRHRIESCGTLDRAGAQLKLLFQEDGESTVEQFDRTATLAAGQWCVIDKTQPFRMTAPALSRQLAISVSRDDLPERSATLPLVRPQDFLRSAAQVLHAGAAAAMTSAPALGRRDRARLGAVLLTMLDFVRDADPPTGTQNSRGQRRMAVIAFVERHLADPALDVTMIANSLGYSKRTLHKLFADDATTVSRLIWDRRLEHCRMDLSDPSSASRSITEIAHGWGFSDSQHFSRAFKSRYNSCPREFRSRTMAH